MLIGSVTVGLAAASVLLFPRAAQAACSSSYKIWTQGTTASPAIASRPAVDTGLPAAPNRSRAFVVQGVELLTYYNQNYPLGCAPGTGALCSPTGGTCTKLKGCKLPSWSTSPATTLNGFPNPVPFSRDTSKAYLFLSGGDGRLYRVDISGDPSPTYPSISADTRRPSCSTDKVIATPAVQLYAYSNQAFTNEVDSHAGHTQDDVVIVVTNTGCGDQTHNRVIAYWASDLSVKWTFNAPVLPGAEAGPIRMGGGVEGCTLDSVNNRLFCGTDAPPGSSQDSVWAINTLNGQLLWSANPGGAVLTRPVLHTNGKLYVVSKPGSLWAYAPAGNGFGGPTKLWTAGLTVASPGAFVTRSPWVEPRAGTWKDKILVLDSAGRLFAVQDDGAGGSLIWSLRPTDASNWVSTPVVLPGPAESRAFIGRDDGFLQMIKLDGGQPEGIIQVTSSPGQDVFDPTVDFDDSTMLPAVIVVGGTTIARIRVPICTDAPGPSATSCFDECVLPQGNPPDWDPTCISPDESCRTYSCRDPGFNPKYNPCRALGSPTSACIGNDYPDCLFGGVGCTDQGWAPDGTACDDGWPGSPGPPADKGASTCRSDAIPGLAACALAEGQDCNPQTGASQPGSRFKCVTKPSVCGSVGGGKCCVCNDGYGMNCNDRCDKGQCVSDQFVGCPGGPDSACIEAGDRACASGSTCCGSHKGGVCSSDLNCTASPQGRCLDLNPLDADGTKYCYYQQCVDLNDDPQHCGACGNDCGEYTVSAVACSDDLGCGTCTNDAQCAAFGGKCVDGACGRCQGNTSDAGSSACGAACAADSQCGSGKCTNGFCCAAGTECVTGLCRPLVCHHLTNRGVCEGGVCTTGAACVGPDLSDLVSAGPIGMCSLDFEFTSEAGGTSLCRAYATSYRTDGGAALAKIDEAGTLTPYPANPPDLAHLNGVAVSLDGSHVFSAMVDNGTPGTPGLALRGPSATTYSRVKAATLTGGVDDNPFDQAGFNTGPVGPAFDTATFTGAASRRMWFGNFRCPVSPVDGPCACADLGLCRVDFSNGTTWSATPETYCNQPCTDVDGRCEYSGTCVGAPQRITAIAYLRRPVATSDDLHREVIVAHGTTLSFVDLDGGAPRQSDINLASAAVCTPDAARGESTIEAILSIAVVPHGDLALEVRGAGNGPPPGNIKNTWLLDIVPHDHSCRHERDVQRALKHVNPCGAGNSCPSGLACTNGVCMKTCGSCPAGFTCTAGFCRIDEEVPANFGIGVGLDGGNGRLAVAPSGRLLRWVARINANPTASAEYDLTPSATGAQPVCNDGNPCTTDSYDSTAGQCTYLPVSCDDLDLCTADSCDPGTGACLHAPIVLTEPGPMQFASNTSMAWQPTPDATHWNTYRGTIPAGSLGSRPPGAEYDQTCLESADALGDGPTSATDAAVPPVGTAFYYLVSGEAGCESAIGHASSGASIPNSSPCPTPP